MKQDPFDLFADALWQFYETGRADLRTERDDEFVRREYVENYFANYADFPAHEKRALKFARGLDAPSSKKVKKDREKRQRDVALVLDIGCGAGRHSLYLQRCGVRVAAIDVSPRIVQLAQTRGVRDARVVDISHKLPFTNNSFDTVLLFGNNLGIAGSIPRFRKMLRELHRVTKPRARILATTRMPSTTNPAHRSYLRKNLQHGRYLGQIRLRLILNGKRGTWFDLLLLAPTDLMWIALEEKWELTHVFPLENFESGYAVVMEKA